MNEFLSTLLQAVIIAAVPICAGAAIKGVRATVQYLASKSESEIAKKYLMDVADAISTAVTYTSQTYVDALKARVYKALRDQFAAVLEELRRIEAGANVSDELLDTINMIAVIMDGMKED